LPFSVAPPAAPSPPATVTPPAEETIVRDVNAVPQKKPRGRPKGTSNVSGMHIAGIVDEPRSPENILEVVIQDASSFKKMIKTYIADSTGMEFITFNFLESEIEITGVNHHDNAKLMIRYNANNLAWYYNESPRCPRIAAHNLRTHVKA